MEKKPFVEFLLQLINFILTLCGLGVLFYGLYYLIKWKNTPQPPHVAKTKYVGHHRLLLAFDPSRLLPHTVPLAWFLYLLITVGAVLFITSCCGYIGAASRSPCCLLSYSVFLVGLLLAELGVAAFMLFDHNWNEVIMPADQSGNLHSVYHFVYKNWTIFRWIALMVLILQVMALFLAWYLRREIIRDKYDSSDEESIISPHFVRTAGGRKSSQASSTPSTSKEQIRATTN